MTIFDSIIKKKKGKNQENNLLLIFKLISQKYKAKMLLTVFVFSFLNAFIYFNVLENLRLFDFSSSQQSEDETAVFDTTKKLLKNESVDNEERKRATNFFLEKENKKKIGILDKKDFCCSLIFLKWRIVFLNNLSFWSWFVFVVIPFFFLLRPTFAIINFFWTEYCCCFLKKELKMDLIETLLNSDFHTASKANRDAQAFISNEIEEISDGIWEIPQKISFAIWYFIFSLVWEIFGEHKTNQALKFFSLLFFLMGITIVVFAFLVVKSNRLQTIVKRDIIENNKLIFETLNNIEYLKLVSSENVEKEKIRRILDKNFEESKKSLIYTSFCKGIPDWLITANLQHIFLIIVVTLGKFNILFELSSKFFYFEEIRRTLSLVRSFRERFDRIINSLADLDDLISSLKTVERGIDFLKKPEEKNKNNDLLKIEADIKFENVDFSYPETERQILTNFNFVFEKGKSYGISGKNGIGKSTITKTLMKLYSLDKGEIKFGNENIINFNTYDMHQKICYQTNKPPFFSLTIAQNVFYPEKCPEDYEKKLWIIAEKVGISDFISKLPLGFDTILTTTSLGSVNLSEGQKQQISAMKIFLKKYDIYILDEIMSNVSPELRYEVLIHIFEHIKSKSNSITLVIDHHYGIFKHVDEVYQFTNEGLIRTKKALEE